MQGAVFHVPDNVRVLALSAFGKVMICSSGCRKLVRIGAWTVPSFWRGNAVELGGSSSGSPSPWVLGSQVGRLKPMLGAIEKNSTKHV